MAAKRSNPKVEPAKRAGKINPFLAGGESRGPGDRWSHDENNVGSTLLGKVVGWRPTTFKDGKVGKAVIFSPAVVVDEHGALTCHRKIETLLSAALATRIDPDADKGVVFGIEYTGTEPSATRGRADFKTFDVVEQAPAKLVQYLKAEGAAELAALVTAAE